MGGGLGGGHMGGARMGGGFGGGHMAGAHMGRGFGGARVGGGFSRGQFASPGRAFARGFAGQRFAGTRHHFDRDRRFDHDRRFRRGFFFGPDLDFGGFDYACSYGYPYYTANYNCYPPSYF
jgi:hypothetical protein